MRITNKELLKIDSGGRRKAFVAAGGYDGRYRKRIVPCGKRYNRSSEKRQWKGGMRNE